MSREQLTNSANLRKQPQDLLPDWENHSASSAETFLRGIEIILRKQGVVLTPDTKFLEVGSGDGKLINLAEKKGIHITGVDVAHRGVERQSRVVARIEKLPFASESFDVVVSKGVFDSTAYNQDQNLMMQEIKRVLKHGGIYIGSDLQKPPLVKGLTETEGGSRNVYKKT